MPDYPRRGEDAGIRNDPELTSAQQVCNSVFESVEFYEHPKTSQWNETIIVRYPPSITSIPSSSAPS